MVHLLIDGYNLLYALEKGLISSLEEKREELLSRLHKYQVAKNVEMTVVFDSSISAPHGIGRDRYGAIEVVFTHEHDSADDWIKEACRRKERDYVVVTNDHEIIVVAEAMGNLCLSCEEFRTKLNSLVKADEINPYLEGKLDDSPLYPRVSTKKKGVAKKLPKRERRKHHQFKNL
jgi:predicted RNA-binding protein with PIN domain